MKQAYGPPKLSAGSLALVLLAHVGVVAAIHASRTVTPPEPLPALMVQVLTPEQPPAPKTPDITPPKPKPVAKRERPVPVAPIPVLAAKPTPAQPVVDEVRVPPPAPLPPIQAPPPPPQSQQAVAAAAPAPMPAPAAPRFDADYLDNPKPIYPPLSRREREQGKVLLKVYVEASGSPSKVEVATSSGFDRLDKSAINAVSRWRFVPARRGAENVAGWVTVPINFTLND